MKDCHDCAHARHGDWGDADGPRQDRRRCQTCRHWITTDRLVWRAPCDKRVKAFEGEDAGPARVRTMAGFGCHQWSAYKGDEE